MSRGLRLGLIAVPALLFGVALLAWPVTGRTLAARAENAGLAARGDRAAAAEARVRPAL